MDRNFIRFIRKRYDIIQKISYAFETWLWGIYNMWYTYYGCFILVNRVENTHFKILADKKTNKVVTIVCRRFKTYDDAVLVKWCQIRKQQIEAIIVICKFERLDEYIALRRNRSGEMVEFGNIQLINNSDKSNGNTL